ncbi:MAG: hypothetical protein AB7S62_14155, partial [Azoarcus sp.]
MTPDIQSYVLQLPLLLKALATPALFYEVGVLVLAGFLAWVIHRTMRDSLHAGLVAASSKGLRHLTLRTAQRILLPATMLLGVLVGRSALSSAQLPVGLLDVAVPLLLSLVAIRLLVYVLRKGFPVTPALKTWENLISGSIWAMVALHLLGWLPAVEATLDGLAFNIGASRISVLATIKLVALVALLLTLAFWVSGVLERRMRASTHMTPSLQVAFGKFSKVFLITLAFLLAIDAVGIDLTTLKIGRAS